MTTLTAPITAAPIKVDVVNVLDALDAALAERGDDYIYGKPDGRCVYVAVGSPSCLIGAVLHKIGVPLKELSWHGDVCEGSQNATALLTQLEAVRVITLDPSQGRVISAALRSAQREQDTGAPWGRAVGVAKTYIGRYFRVERVVVQVAATTTSYYDRFTQ